MLVLTRTPGKKIHIGNDITITLLEVDHGKKARIGIEAPANVPIWRDELGLHHDPTSVAPHGLEPLHKVTHATR